MDYRFTELRKALLYVKLSIPCRADNGLKTEKAEREAAQESARARQAEVTSLEQQLATSQADLEAEHGLKATLQADVQTLQASTFVALHV